METRRVATTLWLICLLTGSKCQVVEVKKEVFSYPGQTITLPCSFIESDGVKLSQVTWVWDKSGKRENIAVFHPEFQPNYPDSPLSGRVKFLSPSLQNPSIIVSNLTLADAGIFICEYATYPTGNKQGSTRLIILSKPKNSASVMEVLEGKETVAVARCVSAGGQPPGEISWVTTAPGRGNTTSKPNPDGTVTVTSDYLVAPTAAEHNRDVSCVVNHKTQDAPESIKMQLKVQHSPLVSIEGYDNNWYLGRHNAYLACVASGNPAPSVSWKISSGEMPSTVQIIGNKLLVQKVDESVNATFVCEASNRLGVGKHQVSAFVREKRLPEKGAATGSIIGAIIGAILFLALLITAVVLVRKHRRNTENAEGPPKYKPPPPVKAGSTTEMVTKSYEQPPETELLSYMYYDTSHEPVTNLDACDDEDGDGPKGRLHLPSDCLPYMDSPNYTDHRDRQGFEEPMPTVSREDSFISSAMLV